MGDTESPNEKWLRLVHHRLMSSNYCAAPSKESELCVFMSVCRRKREGKGSVSKLVYIQQSVYMGREV